jgi:hypothetical protein
MIKTVARIKPSTGSFKFNAKLVTAAPIFTKGWCVILKESKPYQVRYRFLTQKQLVYY